MITSNAFRITVSSLQRLITLAILISFAIGLYPASVSAAPSLIQVNSTLDRLSNDGKCTLREAVISANKDSSSGSKAGECKAGSGADTIQIPPAVYTLTRTDNGSEDSSSTGDLDVLNSVTIEATGPGVTVVGMAGFTDRIFHVLKGNVTLRGLTISQGNPKAAGGAIYNATVLVIENSTLSLNNSSSDGGAIYNAAAGNLQMRNTTLSANTTTASGGGIANLGTLVLNNVTITGNTADNNPDGNGNGGGVYAVSGSFSLSNTIVSDNFDKSPVIVHPDCSGSMVSGGHNLIKDTNGCAVNGEITSNLTGIDPQLDALGNYGGYTSTHALKAGSPAIDAGNPLLPGSGAGTCELTDQRGASRLSRGLACDIGAYEAGLPNSAVIIRASTQGSNTAVVGQLSSAPNQAFTVRFYSSPTCDPASLINSPVGNPTLVSTDSRGNSIFQASINQDLNGAFVSATVADPTGDLSALSGCVRVGRGNDSWPSAYHLSFPQATLLPAAAEDYIDLPGQSRWYKFTVQPDSKVIVTLTNLKVNYDLTLYKDIPAAYRTIASPQDLLRIDAEFAPDTFSPDAFSPDTFSPDTFSPDAFSPDAFSPDTFSPDTFSPDTFSPDTFSPDTFSPDTFSPDTFSPDTFNPDAFSSAQTRSLIAVSAFDGVAGEGLLVNTWDKAGDFYVRVRGRNGAYSLTAPFRLEVRQVPGICSNLVTAFPDSSLTPTGGGFKTLVLTDFQRLNGKDGEKNALRTKLQAFTSPLTHPEVSGVVLDLSQDDRVVAANAQADDHPQCPVAKNLVAGAIKELVDRYWAVNPTLEYIVLVGDDEVVPFFRYPDQALLASEKNYAPPVKDSTSSQASLKLGYFLGQDQYGAQQVISLKDGSLPIPRLAVGRLVETAAEASGMLDAYLETSNGELSPPASSLVTGYDFLEDAALAVQEQLSQGIGAGPGAQMDTLIAPRSLSPADPASWTASDLRQQLLGNRHDLIFLAGHFSANSTLAADYTTRLTTDDLINSAVDLKNAVVFSVGCHSGYNIIDEHGIFGVTRQPDWAQAFAQKQATLLAGTGYQYGDTDFIRYSEQLYLEFSRQLRTGSGRVPLGKAFVAAKQAYISKTPYLRAIDEKSLLQATLFGLPMLSVNMPGERLTPVSEPSLVSAVQPYSANPGAALGLRYADISRSYTLIQNTVDLTEVGNVAQTSTATYLSGPDGLAANPNEPVLPLELAEVGVSDKALRGVGFRGGSFTDLPDIFPLTGAATTEVRGVHAPFISNVLFPIRPWNANYFDALIAGESNPTRLAILPAQYKSSDSSSSTGILRRFDRMDFRLFYSDNITSIINGNYTSIPALSAPPSISRISSTIADGKVNFQMRIVGNPAAGIQEVWITYTALNGPWSGQWQSLDLAQNPLDSRLWAGSLPLNGVSPADVRYMVQAVNGVGLTSLETNHGEYFVPGVQVEPDQVTNLQLISPPSSAAYSTEVTLSASLTSNNLPLAGQAVSFAIGPQSRLALTNNNGVATTTFSIYGLPGDSEVKASFSGTAQYLAASDADPFTITRQSTQLTPNPIDAQGYPEDQVLLQIELRDGQNNRLGEETVFFVITGNGYSYAASEITDYVGHASLGSLPLPPGLYQVGIYFSGSIPLPTGGLTLTDDRYLSSQALGTLRLLNRHPIAQDDAYSTVAGQVLVVPAPGVLSNDSDPEGNALTALLANAPVNGSILLRPDGSFEYTPASGFSGPDLFSYFANDGMDNSNLANVRITVSPSNQVPICSAAYASEVSLWPPDKRLVPVSILGVTDPDGDPVTITITAVWQDEPVRSAPDAFLHGSYVDLRADRDGTGNGRVYHIYFTAADGRGGACNGIILLGVIPHDQGGDLTTIDGGALYDSTLPQ